MPYRSRKQQKHYKRHTRAVQKQEGLCEFCNISAGNPQFIEETKSFKVIHNIFPYSYWDYKNVDDHLMIVPKKHIDSLNDLTGDEAKEYILLLGSYESRGYNVYARARGSTMKSVVHQHTHLIKSREGMVKLLLFVKRPYFRLMR